MERKVKYNYHYGKEEENISSSKDSNKIISANELFDTDEEIAQKYDNVSKGPISKLADELTIDAIRDIERLTRATISLQIQRTG
jgi:ATP-dependent DNA helicase DinG